LIDRKEELYQTKFCPFLISLAILIKPKNHDVLEALNMIQFHHTILYLINTKPLTNWQV